MRGATKTAHIKLHVGFVYFKNRFIGSPISHFSASHVSFLGHFPDVAYLLMMWQLVTLVTHFFVDTDTQFGHISLITLLMNRPDQHK